MLTLRVGSAWNSGAPSGGYWLHGLASFGDLALASTLRRPSDSDGGGGLLTASWSVRRPSGTSLPPQLAKGALVEVKVASFVVGMATIAEVSSDGQVTADGLFRLGESFLAVDASGLPTRDLSVAVQQAIGRGLRWRDPGVTGTVPDDASGNYNTVSALLNKWCSLNGKIWWIDRRGWLRIGDYPTAPRWLLAPSMPSMESADDDFTSRQFVRYKNSATSLTAGTSATDATARVVRETAMDLTQLGGITTTAANGYAAAVLATNAYRTGFTEGLNVIRGQMTSLGGIAPEPWQVLAGDPTMVRSPNWVSATSRIQIGRRRDWILGGAQWKQGDPLTVLPMGMAPRTVASIEQDTAGNEALVFK